MSADRPINADVESAPEDDAAAAAGPEPPKTEPEAPKVGGEPEKPETPEPEPKPAVPSPIEPPADEATQSAPPPPRRRRKGIPGAIKLVAALVLLAIGFIVLAIVAGSGGSSKKDATTTVATTGAAPVIAAPSEPAETGDESEGGQGDEGAAEAPTTSAEELGYPAFATDNTTRVGGADPATIAAASALAVFPSTTAKQRPAAVTVVSEQGRTAAAIAAAAAVMMAPPIRAPLLFTTRQGLPASTTAALEALDPRGSSATDGLAAFEAGAFGDVLLGGGRTMEMVGAKGETSEIVANFAREREKLAGGPPNAYLLAPYAPEYVSPAAAWAARSGDPVLATSGKELDPRYRELLVEHRKVPVFVLGPTSEISEELMKEVKKIGNPVKRVAGKSPVANALAFARYGAGKFGWDVNDPGHGFVLSRSQEPLAAVAASALSASGTWGPLLLTDSADTLPDEVREYFLDVKPGYTTDPTRAFYNHVWVIGDQEAIDVKQQAEVNELAELAKIGEGSEG